MGKTTSRRAPSRTDRREQALHRRRQQAMARTKAARHAARRKRQLKGTAAFLAVAAAGTGVFFAARGGDDAPSRELRAKKVPGASGRLPIVPVPTAYHVVYRAEAYDGSDVTVSTEDVTIKRPFDGKVTIREGEPPGSTAQFEGRSQFGVYANLTDAGAAQIAGDAPTVALGDIRLAASLDALVDEGLFVVGDRRRLLDRQCQTYRTGSPVQALKITAPTVTDYVDVCLDETGLILEEVVIAGDKLAQRLIATSVQLDPALDAAGFAIEGERLPADQGGAVVTEVDRTTAPLAGYWALGAPPAGFTHTGRYLVAGQQSTYVDVYIRGVDLVTVRQGAPAAEPQMDAGPGRDVDLGPLGAGQVILRSVGPTLVAHPAGDAFVHVTGTLSPADLETIAESLRKT